VTLFREWCTRPEVDPEDPLLRASAAPREADHLLVLEEQRSALLGALADLPQEQREVVQRAYFAGRSLSEIASEQSLPLGTVKTRARLALARLRGTLVAARQEES